MWSHLRSLLVCKIPLPIQTAHHTFLESRHSEVTKNLYYVLSTYRSTQSFTMLTYHQWLCWKKIWFALMENMQTWKQITIYTIYTILHSCRNQSIDLECKPFDYLKGTIANCLNLCKGTIDSKSFQFFWSTVCSNGSVTVIYMITVSTDWVKYQLPTKPCISAIFGISPLSANFTKWSNTLNLSVFDHFVVLALKGLRLEKYCHKTSSYNVA